MGKSAPSPPDPVQTANAQAAANAEAARETAKVNAIDIFSPYGSSIFNRDAEGLPTSQTITLSPDQQQILDQQNDLGLFLGNAALNQAEFLPTQQFSLDDVGVAPQVGGYADRVNQVRQSIFDRGVSLLQPEFDKQKDAYFQELQNRGQPIGGEFADEYLGDITRENNRALTDLALQADIQAGQEQNRLFGLEQNAYQTNLSNQLLERQQPFNELSAYLQGTPIFQNNAAQGLPVASNVAPADISGLISNNYNTRAGIYNSNMGALAGLAGSAATAAALSDRRAKTDIKRSGTMGGFKAYTFRYHGDPIVYRGVMAQEVAEERPDAVVTMPNGMFGVDYGKLGIEMEVVG